MLETKAIDRFFSGDINFVFGVNHANHFPPEDLPEIAFIGKSNVGKSTLINNLTNRRSLARVSHTPGRTKQINFFQVGDKLKLVDLPGYGYAKVNFEQHHSWEKMITRYLKYRESLKLICLLIDSRRGLKPNDHIVLELLHSLNKDIWMVFTKEDKISKLEYTNLMNEFNELHNRNQQIKNLIFTSSRSISGVATFKINFWKYIQAFIN